VVSRKSATWRAEKPRTSRSTSTARCPARQGLEHGDEGQLYAFMRLVAGLGSHLRRAQHGVRVRLQPLCLGKRCPARTEIHRKLMPNLPSIMVKHRLVVIL
jgi:hypothetical protein